MELIEEYEEAAEALQKKTKVFAEPEGLERMSDDFHLQVFQDCGEICAIYDVPKEDRIDLICDCIAEQAYANIDQEIDQLRWQMKVMRDL